MTALLPLYRHPTLTVLVDDDRSSLAVLQYSIEPTIAKKTFLKAREAVRWMIETCASVVRLSAPVTAPTFDANGKSLGCGKSAEDDLEQIYRYVENPQRFSLPTVVVIDYSMPDMDGIEFCEAVDDLPCKKILFTSLADDKVALSAFNRGLINRFVRKQEPDSIDRLEAQIEVLQQEYFVEQSRSEADRLDKHSFRFLKDPAAGALVQDLCDRYGFVEYYLFTNPSGFLFFDAHAEPTLLVIQTTESLVAHAQIARDEGAAGGVVEALAGHSVVPFFHTPDGCWRSTAAGKAGDFCKPAQICRGVEDYYWALFELPPHYQKGQPYSHARFLSEHVVSGY